MCLAVPGKIKKLYQHKEHQIPFADIEFGSISKSICMDLLPDAEVGDYVLVHVGLAISKVDEEEAKQVFKYLEEIGEIEELAETYK
ncbi:MAG: HypC/HybG/HupF family hydrogenase formation chaperone [Verrucomicrobiales bacterium]|nr:HypC/HybG/HupF family hydrogenase formation chaperone [Verrucomicrobiales bacterium]